MFGLALSIMEHGKAFQCPTGSALCRWPPLSWRFLYGVQAKTGIRTLFPVFFMAVAPCFQKTPASAPRGPACAAGLLLWAFLLAFTGSAFALAAQKSRELRVLSFQPSDATANIKRIVVRFSESMRPHDGIAEDKAGAPLVLSTEQGALPPGACTWLDHYRAGRRALHSRAGTQRASAEH